MCIKLQSLKTYLTDSQWPNRSILTWVLMQIRSGGDLGSNAQTGRTHLASLRPCVRKSYWRGVKRIYRRRVGERFTITAGQAKGGLIGSNRGRWSGFKKHGWARTTPSYHRPEVGHILAIYLPKQPERVGHGGPSSKSVSNRPCTRSVREGVINSPKHQC